MEAFSLRFSLLAITRSNLITLLKITHRVAEELEARAFAEKWRTVDGTCYEDISTYSSIEQRPWVFNLTDGGRFTAMYYHRPLNDYFNTLGRYLRLELTHEPTLPSSYMADNRYATREFLFSKWVRL
jgi:hypothetical protein